MSGNDRPEFRAYRELETLVRHLGEELATFRRRAMSAEAQLKEAGAGYGRGASASKGESGGGGKSGAGGEHASKLHEENEALAARLKSAEDRVVQMTDRVRFLRQQLQLDTTAKAARS